MRHASLIWPLVFTAAVGIAQTNVTTTGGTANTVPVYTGSSTVGNSPISVTSGGNVGVGTSSPTYGLEVAGDSSFDAGVHIGSFGTGTSPVFLYPNLVSAQFNATDSGTFIVHTDISRTSGEMFKIRVLGYGYGNGFNIDFTVVGYAWNGANGTIDGNAGAVIQYSINDTGNDGLPKYVGIDGNNNVAVGIGSYTGSYYLYRFSADYWTTRENINATSGWYMDQSTASNLGWNDLHQLTPIILQSLSGNVSLPGTGNFGIGTTTPGSGLTMSGGMTINGTGNTMLNIQKSGVNAFALNPTSAGAWTLYDNAAGSWAASITSTSGKIGIGTTSPSSLLSVGSSSQFQVNGSGGVTAGSLALGAPLTVANGGSGVATISGIVKGNGTSPFTAAVAGTDFQAPITLTTTVSTGPPTLSGNVLNIPPISLTTSGTSGEATLSGNVLNIPQYNTATPASLSTGQLTVLNGTGGNVLVGYSSGTADGVQTFGKLALMQLTGDGTNANNSAPGLGLLQININSSSEDVNQSASELYLAATAGLDANTRNSSTQVQSGNILGQIGFFGDDGNDLRTRGAIIQATIDTSDGGTVGTTSLPARLVLATETAPITFNTGLLGSTLHGALPGGGITANERMRIDATGNVGIGTTSPVALLSVGSSSQFQVNASGGATAPSLTVGTLQASGTVQVGVGGIVFPGSTTPQTAPYTGVTCGGDYAESVDVTGDRTSFGPGDLLVIDPNAPGKFLKSAEPYSTSVAGIYSTKPGTLGRRQNTPQSPDEVPMAMVGIVPAKVSAENGAIRPGDLLVSASTFGYAMKGSDRTRMLGAVIGKALGSLDSGTGSIEVLVTLQ